MMKNMLRTVLILGVTFTMALGIAVQSANADTLQSLIDGAKKEKQLNATLYFIKKEHVQKLEAAFNRQYGLDIKIEADLIGRYTVKAKNGVKEYKEGSKPTYDLMILNESAFAVLADADALEKIEGWESLLPEGADRSVSPGPIAGAGFILWDYFSGYSYRSDQINGKMIPLSIKDLSNPALKGKAAVSMYSSNITYAVMKYSPDELLAIAESWGRNDVQKFHPRKLPGQVAKGQFVVGGFHNTDQYLTAGQQGENFKMGLFKEIVPRAVLLLAVRKGAQSPNAAKLFATWMTGKEALDICGQGTYLGNMLNNGNHQAIAMAQDLMKQQNMKAVSFFDSEENYQKLQWLGTPEGQQFTKRIGATLKSPKKK